MTAQRQASACTNRRPPNSRAINPVRSTRPALASIGKTARMEPGARRSSLFRRVPNALEASDKPNREMMLPGRADSKLSILLSDEHWDALYRGWFRYKVSPSTFTWTPFVSVGKVLRRRTMMMTKHGSGAIFASTMYLASSEQTELIAAILQCHQATNELATPTSLRQKARDILIKYGVPLVVGILLSTGALKVVDRLPRNFTTLVVVAIFSSACLALYRLYVFVHQRIKSILAW